MERSVTKRGIWRSRLRPNHRRRAFLIHRCAFAGAAVKRRAPGARTRHIDSIADCWSRPEYRAETRHFAAGGAMGSAWEAGRQGFMRAEEGI